MHSTSKRMVTDAAGVAQSLLCFVLWFGVTAQFMRFPTGFGTLWVTVAGLLFVFRYARTEALSPEQVAAWRLRSVGSEWRWLLLASLALGIFDAAFSKLYRLWLAIPPDSTHHLADSGDSLAWIPYVSFAVAVGPIMEEFCYRGWIQGHLEERHGVVTGLLVSSFLFAAGHLMADFFFYYFVWGIFLGLTVYISNSIWAGVIVHMLSNAASVVGSSIQLEPSFREMLSRPSLGAALLVLICASSTAFTGWTFIKISEITSRPPVNKAPSW